MNNRYTTGRKTRRGNLLTSQPYTGCNTSMAMNVPVNRACSVKSPMAIPRAENQAISAGGNTASTSAAAPIASRTGRNT